MEDELQFIKSYVALINLSALCEKYGLSYDQTRHVLKGDKPLSEKFFNKLCAVFIQFEKDQEIIRDNFYFCNPQ